MFSKHHPQLKSSEKLFLPEWQSLCVCVCVCVCGERERERERERMRYSLRNWLTQLWNLSSTKSTEYVVGGLETQGRVAV